MTGLALQPSQMTFMWTSISLDMGVPESRATSWPLAAASSPASALIFFSSAIADSPSSLASSMTRGTMSGGSCDTTMTTCGSASPSPMLPSSKPMRTSSSSKRAGSWILSTTRRPARARVGRASWSSTLPRTFLISCWMKHCIMASMGLGIVGGGAPAPALCAPGASGAGSGVGSGSAGLSAARCTVTSSLAMCGLPSSGVTNSSASISVWPLSVHQSPSSSL
mmetsp:Transcript_73282/g.158626  ORF Transcript_73282/g.158626 Transcript_73282/m.158626 type:complete len:223 (-) Transcript_73282:280-948(-)